MSTNSRKPVPEAAFQARISAALDTAMAKRPEVRHRADFDAVWRDLGYPNDPALKRRTFARFAPQFMAMDARSDLRNALAVDNWKRRMESARRLGRLQGRRLVVAEQDRALTAALDRAAATAQLRCERDRRRRGWWRM